MTYQYFNVGPNMMMYELNVSDLDDLIFPSAEVHEWCRVRTDSYAGIQAFADMVNEFGQLGGFLIVEEVLKHIADGQFETNAKYLLSLQTFLKRTLPLWTR